MARGESAADSGLVVFSIVDDHPDLCYGVLGRLPQENSTFAAGVMAATVEEFLALDAAETRPSDVVLLDLRLRDGSAPAQNIARLKTAGYPVVIYTDEERPERLIGTLGIGADAVLCKNEAGLLPEALLAVANGDHSWVSPLMASVVLVAPGPRLSPAQMEVLRRQPSWPMIRLEPAGSHPPGFLAQTGSPRALWSRSLGGVAMGPDQPAE